MKKVKESFLPNSINFKMMNRLWHLMQEYESDVGPDEYFDKMVKDITQYGELYPKSIWFYFALAFLSYKNEKCKESQPES